MDSNELPQEQRTYRRRRSAGAILLVFFVGAFLGAVFDASLRPNDITFDVDPTTKILNLVPRTGDRVHWIQPGTGGLIPGKYQVAFLTPPPCKGPASPTYSDCTVDQQVYSLYGCHSGECVDPGFDPSTTTGNMLELEIGAPFEDVERAFELLAHSGSRPPEIRRPVINFPPHPILRPPAPLPPLGISCDPKTTTPLVSWNEPPYNDAPLPVAVGQTAQWRAGPLNFTLDVPPNTCDQQKNGPINSSNPNCTVLSTAQFPVTYHVKIEGGVCGTNLGSAELSLSTSTGNSKQ